MPFLTEMPGQDRCEIGVALGGEHRERVSGRPHHEPGNPLLEADPERSRECAVNDRNRPRRAAEQDGLGERPVQRGLEALDMGAGPDHAISAPPPNEKNDRKKLDAANAMLSPKMI